MSDTDKVTSLFDDKSGFQSILKIEPAPDDHLTKQIVTLQRWRKILACRWLAFIALIGALSIWSYATIDPTPWRFGVSVGYSALVLIPTFGLYFFRSD